MKYNLSILVILVGSALTGCGHPSSPFGAFAKDDWVNDCETTLVREDPRDPNTPGPILRDGGHAFNRATHRYRCPPPGWAVYADADDRVVGLCVDDDTRPFARSQGTFAETVDHETDRARKLITAHWGPKLAGAMLENVEDHCAPKSEAVGHGIVRWGTIELSYPHPEAVHSQFMCCWETRN